jgi:hypothetical protein
LYFFSFLTGKTGKSNKVVSILYETRHKYGSAHRFSPTADIPQPDGTYVYGRIFAKACCWRYPTLELLKQIEDFQLYINRCNPPNIQPRDLNCLLLLDDLSAKRKLINSEILVEFACACRHARITLFMCVQYFNHVKPDIRTNCDFFMTNSERSDTTKKKMFVEVFSMFPSFKTFQYALKFFTDNFGSLVWFNGGGNRQDLEECVFEYVCAEIDALDKEGKPIRRRVKGDDFTLECRITEKLGKLFCKSEAEIIEEWRKKAQDRMPVFGKTNTDKGKIDVDKMGEGEMKMFRGKNAFVNDEIDDDDDPLLDEEALLQEQEEKEAEARERLKLKRKLDGKGRNRAQADDDDDEDIEDEIEELDDEAEGFARAAKPKRPKMHQDIPVKRSINNNIKSKKRLDPGDVIKSQKGKMRGEGMIVKSGKVAYVLQR